MVQYGGTIRVDESRCHADMGCMRVCPTEAIRVRDGKVRVIESLCIGCGECIRVCRSGTITAVTVSFADLSGFDYTVALPSPVLYGQFARGQTPERILAALEKAGFDSACDLTLTCEQVNAAIAHYLASYRGRRPLISCFCPTLVRLVQMRFPDLIDQILPIESPKEILARAVRHAKARDLGLAEDKIGIIYLTPCPSKMLDITGHPGKAKSDIDGVIAISDIYRTISSLLPLAGKGEEVERRRMSGVGMSWAILGGQTTFLKPEDCLAVDGLRNVLRILEDVEMGRMRDVDFVELHTCPDGCVSGSLVVENPYVARARILAILGQLGDEPRSSKSELADFCEKGDYVRDRKLAAAAQGPLDPNVGRAIDKIRRLEEIRESLPSINCGACGAPSCAAFAEDVVRDEAHVNDCVVLSLQQLRAEKAQAGNPPAADGSKGKQP